MYTYLRLMGCLTWILAIIGLIMAIVCLCKAIMDRRSLMYILGSIVSMVIVTALGSGVGILFFQVANLIK